MGEMAGRGWLALAVVVSLSGCDGATVAGRGEALEIVDVTEVVADRPRDDGIDCDRDIWHCAPPPRGEYPNYPLPRDPGGGGTGTPSDAGVAMDSGAAVADAGPRDSGAADACVMRSRTEDCFNRVDDNCDGRFDCGDAQCILAGGDCSRETQCFDRADDNGDGLVDCADPDCQSRYPEQCIERDCDNSLDDDGDGLTDCDDLDCQASGACDPRERDCNNGIDDDGDFLGDYCDPDCRGVVSFMAPYLDDTPCSESSRDECSDGFDNDIDGATDCDDAVCRAMQPRLCPSPPDEEEERR